MSRLDERITAVTVPPWRWRRALWISACMLPCIFVLAMHAIARANEGPILTSTPPNVQILGTLPDGDFTAAIRLTASETITNVRILVTDLHDVTGDQRLRDPMPASSVELSPQPAFEQLEAGSLTQIVVKVAKPPAAGIYSGTLTIRWEEPSPAQIELDLRVEARSTPSLEVQDPQQLTVSGRYTRKIRRHILLRERSGGSITGLQVLPQDLIKSGTNFVLPANKIQANLERQTVGAGELITATLRLDLSLVPAGEYSGRLVIKGDPDVFLTIPMTVKVADDWGGPFFAVILGVALGLWLTTYTAKGKVRDEYVVRLNDVRDALRNDGALADLERVLAPEAQKVSWHRNPQHGFSQSIGRLEVEIDAAIRSADWTLAEEKLKAASDLLVKWRGNRSNWISQIQYLREVIFGRIYSLEDIKSEREKTPVPIQRLIRKTERAIESADTVDSPAAVSDEADEIMRLLERYLSIYNRISEFDDRLEVVTPGTGKETAQKDLYSLKQDFESLPIDNPGEVAAFDPKLNQFEQKLSSLEPATESATRGVAQPKAAKKMRALHLDPASPAILPPDAYDPASAVERLRRYWFVAYFLAGFLLAMVGLATIYLANDTFGSNWLSDYLTLFIFGLGAETSVASSTEFITRLGIQYKKA